MSTPFTPFIAYVFFLIWAAQEGTEQQAAAAAVVSADDFFGTGGDAFLTCSGQLQAELFASALSRVFTFGPTFRYEYSVVGVSACIMCVCVHACVRVCFIYYYFSLFFVCFFGWLFFVWFATLLKYMLSKCVFADRAERSHTRTHLAEFWMLEPEIAFADLSTVLKLSEALIKEVCIHVYVCMRVCFFFSICMQKQMAQQYEHMYIYDDQFQ